MCLLCDIRKNRIRTEPNFLSLLMAAMEEAKQQEQSQTETDAFVPGTKFTFNNLVGGIEHNAEHPKHGQEVIVVGTDPRKGSDMVCITWMDEGIVKVDMFHPDWLEPVLPLRERGIKQILGVLNGYDTKRAAASALFDIIANNGIDGLGKRNE